MRITTSLSNYDVLRRVAPYAIYAAIGFCACTKAHQQPPEFILNKLGESSQTIPQKQEAEQIVHRPFHTHDACHSTHDGLADHFYAESCSTHAMPAEPPEEKVHPKVQRTYDQYKEGGKDSDSISGKIRHSQKYTGYLEGAAERYNIPVELLRAQMIHESNMKEDAESHVGARGLMQIMPATAKGIHPSCLENITDPATSIYCGARYLGQIMEQFNGNETMALAAYNWGPHRVKTGLTRQGIDLNVCSQEQNQYHMLDYPTLPNETRQYIQRIMATKKVIQDRRDKQKDIKHKKNRPIYARTRKR